MKIGIISVAPPFRGGIAAHTSQLIQSISTHHQITCFNFKRQYPDFLFPGKTQYLDPKEYIKESIECLDSINPFSWGKTIKMIRRDKFDLIIFRYWNPFFAPMMLRIAKKIKKNNPNLKAIGLFDNFKPHESHFYDQIFNLGFVREMHGCIVQSEKVKKEILEIHSAAKVETLFHPLYTKYGKIQLKEQCRVSLGIKSKFTILYFGLVRKYKGLDLLIEATAKLKTIRNDFNVLAVGESYEDSEPLLKLVENCKIEDVFYWENKFVPDNDVAKYFSVADIVVLPYRSASQSGIVQIAYHFNRPVIITKVGGLPEIVEEGKSGYIAYPNSSEDIAKLMNESLDSNKLNEMSEFISTYKEQFSWDSFTKKMLSFIEKL